MGYTHYWGKKRDIKPELWAKITRDVDRLLQLPAVRAVVQFEEDRPLPPVVSTDEIRFNGAGPLAHETFNVLRRLETDPDRTQHRDWGFCKTARKPYDTVVVACLVVLVKHAGGNFSVGSDGQWVDWAAGVELCALAGITVPAVALNRLFRGIQSSKNQPEKGPVGWPKMHDEAPAWLADDRLYQWVRSRVVGGGGWDADSARAFAGGPDDSCGAPDPSVCRAHPGLCGGCKKVALARPRGMKRAASGPVFN